MAKRLKGNAIVLLVISVCVGLVVGMSKIDQENRIECGTVDVIHDLIQRGNAASKGTWPFVVVLSKLSSNKIFCGGTLISTKHILTGTKMILHVALYYAADV